MKTSTDKALSRYRAKRDFRRTREPVGRHEPNRAGQLFVIQKHAARRLHYDFRLELDGTLKSWAVPKGPSLDPAEKRLAVQVEDHPLDYADFEGEIPPGEYGAGRVIVWDRGRWDSDDDDAARAYAKGRMHFTLHGEKLHGRWSLVRMGSEEDQWLLIKARDDYASAVDITAAQPDSVLHKGNGGQRSSRGSTGHAVTQRRTRTSADPHDATAIPRRHPPENFAPQLATLTDRVPAGDDWLHETKYDGYRVLAVRRNGKLSLRSRNGLDWTPRLPHIAAACARLASEEFLLDGELVLLNDEDVSDFHALQQTLHQRSDAALSYFLFDLPFVDGLDLRDQPLQERKRRLQRLLNRAPAPLRYSDHVVGHGAEFHRQACAHGLEGIVSKRCAAAYVPRRTSDWLKIKCALRQEFVIAGFTDPGGARNGFGALLLGYWDGDALRYAGRVGTGFDERGLKALGAQLKRLEVERPPFVDPPQGSEARGVHWCRPERVGEVAFTGWTRDGRLRHPSFQGLRADKPARAVVRERALAAPRDKHPQSETSSAHTPARRSSQQRDDGAATVAGVTITHPDRVLYPAQGITKRELAEYYAAVADWVLPGIIDRPLTLVRCPQGRAKQCFFQKHLTETLPAPVHGVDIEEKDERATYIVVRDLPGLITLVQFGALELHPWPARADRQDRPDRLIFDLDPGPGVTVKRLVAAARELRDTLAELGLQSFVRTSGGKGLHVVAPLARRHDWNSFREFAEAVARLLALRAPEDYVASARKSLRAGRIFVDYLRNTRGATSVASYSARARPGAPVATPLRWEELGKLRAPDQFSVRTLPRRLAGLREDPWEGFEQLQQRLPKL